MKALRRLRVSVGSKLASAAVGPLLLQAGLAVELQGDLRIHDPSTIVRGGDRYYVFGTGPGIISKSSTDLVTWTAGPRVFAAPPAWTTNAVPGFKGAFWAPDLVFTNGHYWLYYSVSTWGSPVSAIGLVTNPTLNPADPAYRWTDRGLVVQSRAGDDFNAIDPAVARDAGGKLWLAFGSYWSGIKLVPLDSTTGKPPAPQTPRYSLAWNSSIEAACVHYRAGWYYLFVNWDRCCAGVKSTYNLRVGRSRQITGPYLDRAGKDMREGGGTLFLGTAGRYIGPGHIGILDTRGTNWLSFHFYDGNNRGRPTLEIRPLDWTADGWPAVASTVDRTASDSAKPVDRP
jgi:arabinan endo-1,5-alpha-L-arabinosidase